MIERTSLTVDGLELEVVVRRARVKHVNARLRDGTLRVSAPPAMPEAELERVVADLARRLVRRTRARQVNREDDAAALARRVAARFAHPPAVAGVRWVTTQRRRWGSYSLRTRLVRLNAALRPMPAWVVEAVMAHELAHVVHPDHSPAFWELLRRVCPHTDRARGFLEGVGWLAGGWRELPPVERALLAGGGESE